MITAELQGRRLVLTVMDDDGPAFAPYSIQPMSGQAGRELSTRYLFAIEGLGGEPVDLAADTIAAFGAENFERANQECTTSEGEMLAHAAYFWQSVGGIDAVRALLEVGQDGNQGGGEPLSKAVAVFRLRMVPYLSQIRHRLESATRTLAESSPATATPNGSETSAPAQLSESSTPATAHKRSRATSASD